MGSSHLFAIQVFVPCLPIDAHLHIDPLVCLTLHTRVWGYM